MQFLRRILSVTQNIFELFLNQYKGKFKKSFIQYYIEYKSYWNKKRIELKQ